MTELLEPVAIGQDRERLDGRAKVTGTAPYAYDHPVDEPAYLWLVQAPVTRGRITGIDDHAARSLDGVLAVVSHENAPELSTEDRELAVLQSDEVAFRGQIVAAVLAETPEIARQAAGLVRVSYAEQPHDVELRADRDDLYAPDTVNPSYPTDTAQGDVASAMARAPMTVDQTYTTAWYHNNPMEPHTTVARWTGGSLELFDSTQGVHTVRSAIAPLFGLAEEQVRVIAPYVGGGFGSKGTVHAPVVLAAMAARLLPGRPVKLAVTRQQMFSLVGYRTPTIQHVQLGADTGGRLWAIAMDVVEQTSRIKEFAEQTGRPARMMYAAGNRRTTHRLAALDVPVPSWMRAPGECPGMFGPEVAMDELAQACGIDPIELRIRNEPQVDPDSGRPFSSRHLVECLREGAHRFGWNDRDPAPGRRRENGWLIGTGVSSSTYPAYRMPGSAARVRFGADGRYRVEIGAADIGTGAWTALTQIAADALGVHPDRVELAIGDSALPKATVAGGSSGTASWGSTIVAAARAFRDKFGDDPAAGNEADGAAAQNSSGQNSSGQNSSGQNPSGGKKVARHAFGAQFAEVRVHEDTGEVRVPRLLGVFAVGRIVNTRTARSQFLGGMTMGLSMALHEQSVLDPHLGHIINHDFAEYHIAANADVGDIQAYWLDEHDPHLNPLGSKGIGEIGIVGTAAAVVNAAWHATGIRIRNLPVTLDKFVR